MAMRKYDELLEASQQRRKQYNNYESECRAFINQFRKHFIKFLDCAEGGVEWMRFAEEVLDREEVIELLSGMKIAVREDAFCRFVFRINFDREYVDVPFAIKTVDEKWIVELPGKKRQTMQKDSQANLDDLVRQVFEGVKEFLETEFDQFLQEKPRTLGFKTSRGPSE